MPSSEEIEMQKSGSSSQGYPTLARSPDQGGVNSAMNLSTGSVQSFEDEPASEDPPRLVRTNTAASSIAYAVQRDIKSAKRKRWNALRQMKKGKEKIAARFSSQSHSSVGENPTSSKFRGPPRTVFLNQTPTWTSATDGKSKSNAGASNLAGVHHAIAQTYKRNKIRTSKYTLLTFVPYNLYEQFRRIANVYFLILIIMQAFPIFGAASPQLAMIPLVVIVGITAAKHGYEDYRRHIQDTQLNNTPVIRLGGEFLNVNQNIGKRSFLQRLLGRKDRQAYLRSKRVRKLRDRDPLTEYGVSYVTMDGLDGDELPAPALEYVSQDRSEPSPPRNKVREAASSKASSIVYPEGVTNSPRLRPSSIATPARRRALSRLNSSTIPKTNTASSAPRETVLDYSSSPSNAGSAKWEMSLWKKLEVGDIVLLRNDDAIPADLVILSTSDPEGHCYVETKNLDGESNLKQRHALKATYDICSELDLEHAQFSLESEPPHADLYSYNGVLRYRSAAESGPPLDQASLSSSWGKESVASSSEYPPRRSTVEKAEPISINEILLRGCNLRNTDWIIGLVLFTGDDSKILLNAGQTPSKRSKIEKETNYNVAMNFIVLVALCLVVAIGNLLFEGRRYSTDKSFEYGGIAGSRAKNAVVNFVAGLILFQNIVPISLYISIEIVKTFQAYFILQDVEMYYQELDYPCLPRNWSISDDLGQIEYVFSDKTGTLTQNVMEFRRCTINSVAYGEGKTDAMIGAAIREGGSGTLKYPSETDNLQDSRSEMLDGLAQLFTNPYVREELVTFVARNLAADLQHKEGQQRERIIDFFTSLAICHTVLPDRTDPSDPTYLEYKAQSPDEAALVAAARDVGFVFLGKSGDMLEIEVMGEKKRYKLLKTLEFNSTRKRMSVIVQGSDQRKLLICKGADSVIYRRLAQNTDDKLKDQTWKDLERFANEGLRTLCISSRYLDDTEYDSWSRTYDQAANALVDRQDKVDTAAESIEKDLRLLGGTAIEDRLQDGVPESIAMLHQGGLKVWVLTGDKMETAINIGYSCSLLRPDMSLIMLNAESVEQALEQIESALNDITQSRLTEKSLSTGHAVIIDGETLKATLDPRIRPLFLQLGQCCESVICCRVSPAQKAQVVSMVKNDLKTMTLAIGDGANDVAMIQEAHIGVGIAGQEGAQAVMSSDYAIGQFRFLTRLLLVHGRWSYNRIAEMHGVFFYKNIVWVYTAFFYQAFTSFNASYLYDYTFLMLYNLAFTSLPVMVLGTFDQDVDAKASMAYPALYKRGIQGLEYTKTKFWLFVVDASYQGAICFWIPYLIFHSITTAVPGGHDVDLWEFGTAVACGAVLTVNVYAGLHLRYWTWMVFAVIIISCGSIFAWIAFYSVVSPWQYKWVVARLYPSINFWASVALVTVISLLPRFLYYFVRSTWSPRDIDIVREECKYTPEKHERQVEAHLPSTVEETPVSRLSVDVRHSLALRRESIAPVAPPTGLLPRRSIGGRATAPRVSLAQKKAAETMGLRDAEIIKANEKFFMSPAERLRLQELHQDADGDTSRSGQLIDLEQGRSIDALDLSGSPRPGFSRRTTAASSMYREDFADPFDASFGERSGYRSRSGTQTTPLMGASRLRDAPPFYLDEAEELEEMPPERSARDTGRSKSIW